MRGQSNTLRIRLPMPVPAGVRLRAICVILPPAANRAESMRSKNDSASADTTLFVHGDVPREVQILACPPPKRTLHIPSDSASHRVTVAALVEYARAQRSGEGDCVVLTDRDLDVPGCDSLFGYADRAHGVAVVSTARLGAGASAGQLAARVRNAVAHERGHLRGLSHCASSICLMHAAGRPEDLDRRAGDACGSCPSAVGRFASIGRQLVGLAVLFLLVAAINLIVTTAPSVHPPFQMPFT